MSIVDGAGERVFLAPEPDRARPVRSERVRRRNFDWLAEQRRHDDLTVRELARHLEVPLATLAQGLLWAAEEKSRAEAAEVERERRAMAPVLDPESGLDVDDVLYLLGEYPPESDLGSHPLFWQVLGPLWDKVVATYGPTPEVADPLAA